MECGSYSNSLSGQEFKFYSLEIGKVVPSAGSTQCTRYFYFLTVFGVIHRSIYAWKSYVFHVYKRYKLRIYFHYLKKKTKVNTVTSLFCLCFSCPPFLFSSI